MTEPIIIHTQKGGKGSTAGLILIATELIKNLAAILTWCRNEDKGRIKEIMRKIEEENK